MKKPKSKVGWIIMGVILLIVIVIVIIATKKKKPATETTTTNSIDSSVFPLQFGSQNDYVLKLQKWLLGKGAALPVFGPDGIFGEETKAALVSVTGKDFVDYTTYSQIIAG